jgi:hypothetical protein
MRNYHSVSLNVWDGSGHALNHPASQPHRLSSCRKGLSRRCIICSLFRLTRKYCLMVPLCVVWTVAVSLSQTCTYTHRERETVSSRYTQSLRSVSLRKISVVPEKVSLGSESGFAILPLSSSSYSLSWLCLLIDAVRALLFVC